MGQIHSVNKLGYFNLDLDNRVNGDTLYVCLDNEDYTKDITHEIVHIVFEVQKVQPYRLPQHIKHVSFRHQNFNQSIEWLSDSVEHITIGTLDKNLYEKIFNEYLDLDQNLDADYYDFMYDCKDDVNENQEINSGSSFNQEIIKLPSQLQTLKIYNENFNKDIIIKSNKIKYIIKGGVNKMKVYDRFKGLKHTYL